MNFCHQGKQYLNNYDRKQETNALNYNNSSVIEGFTGAFGGNEATDINKLQTKYTKHISDRYNKALSNYATSENVLMEETASYVNTTLDSENDSSNSYTSGLIKLKNGELGYITDKSVFKHIPSTDVLNSIQGRRGCPSTVTSVDFTSDTYNTIGKKLNSETDITVGNPMSSDEACVSSGVNLQVMGATDPTTNLANWKGCWKGVSDHFEKQSDLQEFTNGSEAIAACQLRAADTGASGFYIGSNNNKYTCYTAKSGQSMKHIEKHSEPGIIIKKSQNIIAGPAKSHSSYIPAAGILNNGQVALGTILTDSDNFGENVDATTIWSQESANDNCDATYGTKIEVQSASYGLNCDGVSENNWLKNTKTAVDDNNHDQKASFTISNAPGDPAYGCHKDYVSTYSCNPSTELKTVSITGGATGKAAVFDCNKEYINCTDSKLTVSDTGNVSYARGNRNAIWESNTSTIGIGVADYKAEKGKYKRNYLLTGEYLTPGEFIGSPSGTCALMCQTSGSGDSMKAYLNVVYFVLACNQQGQEPTTKGSYGDITDISGIQAVYSMTDGVQSNKNASKLFYSNSEMTSQKYSDSDVAYKNEQKIKKMSKGKSSCSSGYEAVDKVDCKAAGKSVNKHRRWKGTMSNKNDLSGCFMGPQNWEKDIFEYKSGNYDVQYNKHSTQEANEEQTDEIAAAAGAYAGGPVGAALGVGIAEGVMALQKQTGHQHLLCQKEDVNKNNKYISIGSYYVDDSNIKTMKNTDAESCKSKCNSLQECGGYIYDNSDQSCELRQFGHIFPQNPNRVSNANKEMFVRQLKVSNANSCTSQVDTIAGNIFNAMPVGESMDDSAECSLANATKQQRKLVAKKLEILNKETNKVKKNMNHLIKTNKKLDAGMSKALNKEKRQQKTYKHDKQKFNEISKKMTNINAMEDTSNMDMVSNNLQNTAWTAGVIVAVLVAIKLSR